MWIILGGIFEKNKISEKIKNFDDKISEEKFWKDKLSAQKILKEKNFFEKIIENFKSTINETENLEQLIELALKENDVAVVKDLDAQSFSKGEILNIEWGIHEITIDIEASSKSFLVVSEVHYPKRWKLTVNNEPSETFQVNGVLRGVMVDAGKHRIEFKYESNSFKYLRFLSNSIILLLFLVFGVPFAMRLLKGNT